MHNVASLNRQEGGGERLLPLHSKAQPRVTVNAAGNVHRGSDGGDSPFIHNLNPDKKPDVMYNSIG